jgi:hypothetical protein
MNSNRDNLQEENVPLSSTFSTIKKMQALHIQACGEVFIDAKINHFEYLDQAIINNHILPYLSGNDIFRYGSTSISNYNNIIQYSGYLAIVNPLKIEYLQSRLDSIDERYNKVGCITVKSEIPACCDICSMCGLVLCGCPISISTTTLGIDLLRIGASCCKITVGASCTVSGITASIALCTSSFFFSLSTISGIMKNREENQLKNDIEVLQIKKNH